MQSNLGPSTITDATGDVAVDVTTVATTEAVAMDVHDAQEENEQGGGTSTTSADMNVGVEAAKIRTEVDMELDKEPSSDALEGEMEVRDALNGGDAKADNIDHPRQQQSADGSVTESTKGADDGDDENDDHEEELLRWVSKLRKAPRKHISTWQRYALDKLGFIW